jgi:hypothetical protein
MRKTRQLGTNSKPVSSAERLKAVSSWRPDCTSVAAPEPAVEPLRSPGHPQAWWGLPTISPEVNARLDGATVHRADGPDMSTDRSLFSTAVDQAAHPTVR